MKVELLSGTGTLRRIGELTSLIVDAVEHGAAIGFTLPLAEADVESHWQEVAGDVASGSRELLIALDERGRVVGCAQLTLEAQACGPHRARAHKVLVKHSVRGRGIGAMLMTRLEQEAQAHGCTELFLDSSKGASGASVFCRRLGYAFVENASSHATNPEGGVVASAIYHKLLAAKEPATVFGTRAPHAAMAG